MEDVETALSILEHFITKAQRAKMLMAKVNSVMNQSGMRQGGMNMANFSFDDFVNIAIAVEKKKREGIQNTTSEEPPIGELTPEEVKRMKETVQKMKSKTETKTV
jgi:hypothetical protein